MCRALVERAVADDRLLRVLKIPPAFWNWIAASWKRGDPSLYGGFDLRYDGQGPAKLLEYNADTPTAVFETAVFQWQWLEDAIERSEERRVGKEVACGEAGVYAKRMISGDMYHDADGW